VDDEHIVLGVGEEHDAVVASDPEEGTGAGREEYPAAGIDRDAADGRAADQHRGAADGGVCAVAGVPPERGKHTAVADSAGVIH
jgi:hypothetical protein